MRIFIQRLVYDRVKEYARAQGVSVSQFIETALVKLLGLEGMSPVKAPLDVHEIFGEEGGCQSKGEVEFVNPGASQAVKK